MLKIKNMKYADWQSQTRLQCCHLIRREPKLDIRGMMSSGAIVFKTISRKCARVFLLCDFSYHKAAASTHRNLSISPICRKVDSVKRWLWVSAFHDGYEYEYSSTSMKTNSAGRNIQTIRIQVYLSNRHIMEYRTVPVSLVFFCVPTSSLALLITSIPVHKHMHCTVAKLWAAVLL